MNDVIFISFGESEAEENWELLVDLVPTAKRVTDVAGIDNAHYAAYLKSNAYYFFVIDGDSEVLPNFDFSYKPASGLEEYVHLWYSRNPVNGLEYGYGGIKLFPRSLFKDFTPMKLDFTTGRGKGLVINTTIGSITHFNSSPLEAWRSAFRECAKLASNKINGSIPSENEYRLNIWCSVGKEQKNGEFAILGAQMGRKFGEENSDNFLILENINNFSWLRNEFNTSVYII